MRKDRTYGIIGIILGAGFFAGLTIALFMKAPEPVLAGVPFWGAFFESLVKNMKLALFIWLMAFIPPGNILAGGAVFLRGISYGFALATMVRYWGFSGVLTFLTGIVPQSLLIIPALIYIAKSAVSGYDTKRGTVAPRGKRKSRGLSAYVMCLGIASGMILVGAVVEGVVAGMIG